MKCGKFTDLFSIWAAIPKIEKNISTGNYKEASILFQQSGPQVHPSSGELDNAIETQLKAVVAFAVSLCQPISYPDLRLRADHSIFHH